VRALDMTIASVDMGGTRGSVHDWIQAHPNTTLDLFCSIPYGTFIFVSLAFAVFLYVRDYERMRAFSWTFLFLNLAGFATYHIYPAAPPWYFHAHGCVVDLTAHASEGPNLARVDALLGVHYFAGFYGRASDVFGAVPSLHVGYPMLLVLFGWPVWRWPVRVLALLFLGSMCFAAVYLDHHWIIDVMVGLLYTVTIFVAVRGASRLRVRLLRLRQLPRPVEAE
jgi:membrane-associated phospholipid phosphatase